MCPQRYIWWKKSLDVWTKDHPFPIDIDYMISDMLELLRPKMRLCCCLEESTRLVSDLEREVLVKLGTHACTRRTHGHAFTSLSVSLSLSQTPPPHTHTQTHGRRGRQMRVKQKEKFDT